MPVPIDSAYIPIDSENATIDGLVIDRTFAFAVEANYQFTKPKVDDEP